MPVFSRRAFGPKTLVIVAVAMAALVSVSGCSGIPDDNRYQNTFKGRGGGWENFRAEVPVEVRVVTSVT
jgi:hypothetical protein